VGRKIILALIVAVGLAALGSLLVGRLRYSHQELKSCFNDVQGLRAGAAVRIAGVEVGIVRSVRANPQRKDCPAEVEMELATAYPISIPNDALAEVETGGLLGPPHIGIDSHQASGPPVENYGYLKSKPTASVENQIQALRLLVESVKEAGKETPGDDKSAPHPLKPSR
jgi:phospholipid/cholesterol/gamma-HCH transport system substrate-binding protein